jgi:hypothetical protein
MKKLQKGDIVRIKSIEWYNKFNLKREVFQMLFQETEKTELKKVLNDS